jgi:hypothetical protein
MPSQMHATRSAHSAGQNLPSDESEMDVIPQQAASEVMRLGTIARNGTRSERDSRDFLRLPLIRNLLMTNARERFLRPP